MRCVSSLSVASAFPQAINEALDELGDALRGERADLLVAFVSFRGTDDVEFLAEAIENRRLARHVIGCTAESVVGTGREIERAPAISLWGLVAPGVSVQPVRIDAEGAFTGMPPARSAEAPGGGRVLVLLGDPATFAAEGALSDLDRQVPGLPVVGGMASAGHRPGSNRLILDGLVHQDGAVGAVIEGPIAIATIVSQGCRPIGRPMLITRAERNLIRELGRRPALEVFSETYDALSEADQALVREGLHLGRVINEYQESFGRGDFLVRNVMGADNSGAIAITDLVRVGQTVQFHVRDAVTADEDLTALLAGAGGPTPAGALLFTCNGRGTRLFPGPHHDAHALGERYGPLPLAGFFAMGELGPIGGRNFVHGFTASIALFGPPLAG